MIHELIERGAVAPDAKLKDKEDALRKAAEMLAGGSPGFEADAIYDLLLKREELGSTGIGDSIAIPHASVDELDDFRLAVITVPSGLDFDSIDGKPVKIVFAMMGPSSQRSKHVRILADLSRLTKKEGFIDKLMGAGEAGEVIALFEDAEGEKTEEVATVEKSMLIAMVQEEAYFEPLLEVLASVSIGGMTILEGYGAGRYLHAMPLFSMFWTDDTRKDDVKLILAVIDRHAGNEVIRRISSTVADPGKDPGLMIALQQLSLVSGSLDL